MKKPAVTFLALFYLLLILSRSFEHTTQWVAEAAPHRSSSDNTDGPALAGARNHSTHDSHSRILERDDEGESSSPDVPARLQSLRSAAQTLFSTLLAAARPATSSRAPPAVI